MYIKDSLPSKMTGRTHYKILSVVTSVLLLLNSLWGVFLYPQAVFAQEATESAEISSTPTPEPTEEPENTSLWIENEDGSVTTQDPVGEGVEYRYKDTQVKVVFIKITSPGLLTIREFEPENAEELGIVGKAYEITSDMQDGTFEYNLTLPLPDEAGDDISVKYAENPEELPGAQPVSEPTEIVDNTITIRGLTHFTIFVITDDGATYTGGLWFDYPNQGYLDTGVHFPTTVPPGQTATWAFSSVTPGVYEVYISWSTHPNRTTAAPYILNYNGGSANFTVNQELLADQLTVGGSGQWSGWYSLGSYPLDTSSTLILSSIDNSSGQDYVIADEVRLGQAPTIIYPANGAYKTTANQDKVDWTDSTGTYPPFSYKYESYYDSGYTTLAYSSSWLSASEIPTPGTPAGTYYLRVKAKDSQGNETDWSNGLFNPYLITVDNTAPTSSIFIQGDLDETKNIVGTGGWHGYGWYESYDNVNLSIATGNTALDFIRYQILSGDQVCPAAGDSSYTGSASHGQNIASSVNGSDGERTLCFYAEDLSGNKESGVHKQILRVDNTNPTFNVNSISGINVDGVYYQNSWTVSVDIGINDNLSGYTRARFDLYDADAGHNCTSYIEWNEDNLLPPSLSISRTLVKNGLSDGRYCLRIWTYDDVQNKSGVQTVKFTIDTQAPVTDEPLSSPQNNSFWNQPIQIQGTSTDNFWTELLNLFYKPADSLDPWSDITTLTNDENDAVFDWSYPWIPAVEGIYDIKAAAIDAAGNEETSAYAENITYDVSAPEIVFEEPANESLHAGTIHLKATCNEECDYINFWWRAEGEPYSSDSKRYHYVHDNGTIFEWDLNSLNAQKWDGTTYTLEDGVYYLYAAGKDPAGNWARTPDVQITVDNTPPFEGSLIINGGDLYTNSRDVVLSISASDETSSVTEMSIANGSYYYDWEPYATTKDWQLPDSDGEKTVRAKFKDAAGNVTPTPFVSDTIILDRVDPISLPTSPEPGYYNADTWNGTVEGTASDNRSGVNKVEVSIKVVTPDPGSQTLYWDGDSWEAGQSWLNATGAEIWTYNLVPIEGTYTFYSRATDNAGNTESTGELTGIIYDTTNPELSWTSPIEDTIISGSIVILSVATDNLSGVESVTYLYQRDDGVDGWHEITTITEPPYEAGWDTTGLALDFYNLKAVVRDRAGNFVDSVRRVGVAAVISGETWNRPEFGKITVSWTTDRPTSGRVVYDTTSHSIDPDHPNYGYANTSGVVDNSPKTTSHTVTLSGLLNGITYYWRTVSTGSPVVISKEHRGDTFSIPGPGGGGEGAVAGVATTTVATTGFFVSGVTDEDSVLGEEEEVLEEETRETMDGFERVEEPVLAGGKAIRVVLWGGAVLGGLTLVYFFFRRRKKKL